MSEELKKLKFDNQIDYENSDSYRRMAIEYYKEIIDNEIGEDRDLVNVKHFKIINNTISLFIMSF